MKSMYALRAHERGGPERLSYEMAPVPKAAAGEVLVAVRAAGITFSELDWDLSWQSRDGHSRLPVVPSHEVAGTVAEAGPGVTEFRPGDEVFGLVDFARDGAAAEYVTLPATALSTKPRHASYVESAALPLAALTAWQALVDHAMLTAGQTVLIHGAAGGVGVYAVQLAAAIGAHVTATDVPEQHAFVRELGAARFLGTDHPFDQILSGVDVVLDTVGGTTLDRSYGVIRPGGRLVTLGAPPSAELAARHSVKASFFVVRPDRAQLTHLAALVDAGRLRPVVSATFPLRDGVRAYLSGREPRRPGKTVLLVQ